jgi:GC-rich sequence DNA-binding factor
MSDPPIIFKRTKSKATHRARDAAEAAGAAPQNQEEESPASLVSKIKSKSKQRNKSRTNLSFGGEDEVRVITRKRKYL